MTVEIQRIETERFDGSRLTSTFYVQMDGTDRLAIIYPGAGYPRSGPVLDFVTDVLLAKGFGVLTVEDDYRWLPPVEQRKEFLLQDIESTYSAAIAQRDYQRLVITAKSVGTRGMAAALDQGLCQGFSGSLGIAWLTPGWNAPEAFSIMCAGNYPGLHVMGDADPLYEATKAAAVGTMPRQEVLILPGVDHGFNVASDVAKSIGVVSTVVGAFERWVAKLLS